jgi:hypothetical protein
VFQVGGPLPAGWWTANFNVLTRPPVSANRTVTITTDLGGVMESVILTIEFPSS